MRKVTPTQKPAYNESIQYTRPGFINMKYGVKPTPVPMQRFTKNLPPFCGDAKY